MENKTKKYILYGSAVITVIAAIFAPEEEGAQQAAQVIEPVVKRQAVKEQPEPADGRVTLTLSRQLQMNRITLNGEPGDLFYVDKPPPPKPRKPEPPRAPPLPFTYMGKMIENGQLTIFLTRGDKPYDVHSGDVLDGEYHVDVINPPLMEMTYMPLKEKQSLNIGAIK